MEGGRVEMEPAKPVCKGETRSQGTSLSTELKKKRAFRKFSYRGIDLDQYVEFHSL
jgi:hypothetical protein